MRDILANRHSLPVTVVLNMDKAARRGFFSRLLLGSRSELEWEGARTLHCVYLAEELAVAEAKEAEAKEDEAKAQEATLKLALTPAEAQAAELGVASGEPPSVAQNAHERALGVLKLASQEVRAIGYLIDAQGGPGLPEDGQTQQQQQQQSEKQVHL